MDYEQQQAEEELQQMICDALDRCAAAGADEESLRLLAWQAGVTYWKPNAHARTASLG